MKNHTHFKVFCLSEYPSPITRKEFNRLKWLLLLYYFSDPLWPRQEENGNWQSPSIFIICNSEREASIPLQICPLTSPASIYLTWTTEIQFYLLVSFFWSSLSNFLCNLFAITTILWVMLGWERMNGPTSPREFLQLTVNQPGSFGPTSVFLSVIPHGLFSRFTQYAMA